MLRIVFSSLLCLIGLGCVTESFPLPYYNTPDFMPLFIDNPNAIAERVHHRINDFEATNQYGQKITLDDLKGKVHIANFMFTRCTSICPIMTNHLKTLAKAYKNETRFSMLSFSVTPWMDSIPALRSFAESYSIKAKNWHLLTGEKSEIYRLARRSYFAEKDLGFTKDSAEFLHTEHVVLVDPHLRLRGVYNATLKPDILQLHQDIAQLLNEK
ncbi:MAG: SCO family protein [Flavobacteriaceae bacterium]|nr:SCO family protein [Flavobacteriaceae bacterium]